MSMNAINWAMNQTGLRPTEKLVLITVASMSTVNGQAWPTNQTIAERCGIAKATASLSLRRIKDAGLISMSAAPRQIKINLPT
ncbi:Helix-turn-helix domain-containing protein [Pseudosulfitobacter pseudonitzschiae]|uniref:Helix-turn-helix domain-containing protein n=1 Tax=Pseudosulfitobacter pseudonitzschiae TaxID=1402135 RepID=A0A073J606_9RHOB|nr:helix-turn-helix domain-containing protein [Pseudosulfitobacter pseudonitzschiae]KEJ97404.1 hypothetical protein SUH3_00020 [Pseudosulfitobacter pseudonitzschiae]QKS08696.1 helix-turn-helix domain-containing protein [Pseudosulfitobacter pseudonitzschiae]SHE72097.1 Helix-turn-helix domain-containing protein [Pseudosulfitobacter pseudonitzschiae]